MAAYDQISIRPQFGVKSMASDSTSTSSALTAHLLGQYGPLLSQMQLAELLGRSVGGLRYSLCCPADDRTRNLKACGRKIGRRVYYPAVEIASIIDTLDDN